MTILAYIHGFNSSPLSQTYLRLSDELRTKYNFTECVSLSYNPFDADNAYAKLTSQVEELLKTDTDVIFIGSSLGAFWAEILAMVYHAECILINPSINPSISLQKYIGVNENYVTKVRTVLESQDCATYCKYEEIHKACRRTVIVGMKDDIVDPYQTIAFYHSRGRIVKLENMGHRVEDIAPIINIIIETINNFSDENL